MKDLFCCLHLAKKNTANFWRRPFFLVFSYIWQDISAPKHKKCRGSAQCKYGPEKNYLAFYKSSILTRLRTGCTQRLRTNDFNLTKPAFQKSTED